MLVSPLIYKGLHGYVLCDNTHPVFVLIGHCLSDFNECMVYGACSQTCTNTEGSYICTCVEGYLLQPDNRSCKAKNGERGPEKLQPFIYFDYFAENCIQNYC